MVLYRIASGQYVSDSRESDEDQKEKAIQDDKKEE
jgi:predicted nucleic acid-binding Zn ribbon protein